jgi:hypothetical protein
MHGDMNRNCEISVKNVSSESKEEGAAKLMMPYGLRYGNVIASLFFNGIRNGESKLQVLRDQSLPLRDELRGQPELFMHDGVPATLSTVKFIIDQMRHFQDSGNPDIT